MTYKSKLSVLTLAVLTSLGVQAQKLPAPLIEATRKAVTNNPEVQARFKAFNASTDDRDIARGGYFPQVDLSSTFGNEGREDPTNTNYGRYNYNSTQLTINQMLFDGMFTSNEAKRLGFAKLTRYYELSEMVESTALEALRAYSDVVRYRELVEAATQNYVEHKQTTLLVEERANTGAGRRVDVEQANGRLALAESNLLTELTNLHDVSARYLRVVGEKPPLNLPYLSEQFKLGTLPLSAQELMRDGLQGSPTLHAAVENARAYRTAIDSSKAAYLPRLDLRAYGTVQDNSAGVSGATRVNGLALVLNYNLFRGGADKARERRAVNQSEQALDLKEKACRDVRQNLSTSYSDARTLLEQKTYLDQHRLSTEKAREAYRQQFDIGQRTLLDLLDSQNEYFEASRSYLNAHYNQIIAQARTHAAMGRLLKTINISREDMPSAKDAGQEQEVLEPADLCPQEDVVVDTLAQIKANAVLPQRAKPAPPPAVAPVPKAVPAKVSLASDTLFDFDKSELKPEGQAKLDQLIDGIKTVSIDVIIAVGHTDSIGSDEYNNRLSLARAYAVKTYMVSKGIDAARIKTSGKGKTQPVASNTTKEGRAKNRRVDIEVVQTKGMPDSAPVPQQ